VSTELIRPDGQIRRDEQTVELVAAAIVRDVDLGPLVELAPERVIPAASFGLLFPARWRGSGDDVYVKINANEHERAWLSAIGDVDPDVAPRVYATGECVDDITLPWMVLERLPYLPPGFGGPEWYAPLVRASFRWNAAARSVDLEPWHAIDGPWLNGWFDQLIAAHSTPAVERLRDRFDDDWKWVAEACGAMEPAHGDVHFFNSGSRRPGLPEALMLFDPIPRAAHWPYDVANCQTLTNYAGETPLVVLAARDRRDRGLPTPDDAEIERLSDFFCAWLSVMWRVIFRERAPERVASSEEYIVNALRW
jgi:hypothetical protein